MLTTLPRRLRGLPTPMAGLALGVASLGWCMENALPLNGWGQLIGAFTASALLLLLVLRFVLHTETLWEDLKHPVVGSIVPTFAMSLMVISRALLHAFPTFAAGLWCVGITLHLAALIAFIWFRLRDPVLEKMVPSWFIPPVGIIVADVAFPGVPAFLPFAQTLFVIGLVSYAILLPTMLYRLFFLPQVDTRHSGRACFAVACWAPLRLRASSSDPHSAPFRHRRFDDHRHLLCFLESAASEIFTRLCRFHLPNGDRGNGAL